MIIQTELNNIYSIKDRNIKGFYNRDRTYRNR